MNKSHHDIVMEDLHLKAAGEHFDNVHDKNIEGYRFNQWEICQNCDHYEVRFTHKIRQMCTKTMTGWGKITFCPASDKVFELMKDNWQFGLLNYDEKHELINFMLNDI